MSVITLQDIVYPALMVLSAFMAGLLALTWLTVERRWVILALASYFVVQALEFASLTLVTGHNPMLDIDQFRIWIIRARVPMALLLAVSIALQARRVWRRE